VTPLSLPFVEDSKKRPCKKKREKSERERERERMGEKVFSGSKSGYRPFGGSNDP